MKKKETLLKEKILEDLRRLPNAWFIKTQERSVRAIPDLIGTVCGYFVAIEIKTDSKAHVDPLQEQILQKISEAGGISYLVYKENWEATLKHIKKISESVAGPAKINMN